MHDCDNHTPKVPRRQGKVLTPTKNTPEKFFLSRTYKTINICIVSMTASRLKNQSEFSSKHFVHVELSDINNKKIT